MSFQAIARSIEAAGLPSEEDFFEAVHDNLPRANNSRPLHGPSAMEVRHRVRGLTEHGSQKLNEEQKWAIASFLAGASTNGPFTIYGPPGTGKTVTLVECALQVFLSLILHSYLLLPQYSFKSQVCIKLEWDVPQSTADDCWKTS